MRDTSLDENDVAGHGFVSSLMGLELHVLHDQSTHLINRYEQQIQYELSSQTNIVKLKSE